MQKEQNSGTSKALKNDRYKFKYFNVFQGSYKLCKWKLLKLCEDKNMT